MYLWSFYSCTVKCRKQGFAKSKYNFKNRHLTLDYHCHFLNDLPCINFFLHTRDKCCSGYKRNTTTGHCDSTYNYVLIKETN